MGVIPEEGLKACLP